MANAKISKKIKESVRVMSLRALAYYLIVAQKENWSLQNTTPEKVSGVMREFINKEVRDMGNELSAKQLEELDGLVAQEAFYEMEDLIKISMID